MPIRRIQKRDVTACWRKELLCAKQFVKQGLSSRFVSLSYSRAKNGALAKKLLMNNRRLIISLVVFFGFSMLASGQVRKSNPQPEKARIPVSRKSNLQSEKARDPVCGIMVKKDPQLADEYKGKTYYFCSIADRDKFKKEPEKYVRGK